TSARLVGVEADGGAAVRAGESGVLHGYESYVLQDEAGQILEAHSISAGLDYPGVGPEHAYLASSRRAEYATATDEEVVQAVTRLARSEGILAALESAHALAWIIKAVDEGDLAAGSTVLMTLSGRGDKDASQLAKLQCPR
ncbi:MAG: pyridoxal-phosphate dependent enzyme, partial [Pseudonocardiaceae bacterium]